MQKLASSQVIGAHFSFQHYPLERVAAALRDFGMTEIELWGGAQHLDLVHATGDGNLPLDHYVSELAAHGYTGKVSFEPFGNGSYALDPIATWKRNFAAIEPYLDRTTAKA